MPPCGQSKGRFAGAPLFIRVPRTADALPRAQANADVWDWELGPEDMQALGGLPTQQRMVDGSFWLKSEGPYRTLQHLWDE